MCTEDFPKAGSNHQGDSEFTFCRSKVGFFANRHRRRQDLYRDLPNLHTNQIHLFLIPMDPSSSRLFLDMNGPNPTKIYDVALKNEIISFVRKYPEKIPKVSDLHVALNVYIQDPADMPLEITWVYTAVEFHRSKSVNLPAPGKIFVVKELLKWIKSCSRSSAVIKKVAVIAPVLYFLYRITVDISEIDRCSREEIGDLVEQVVSYICICCSQDFEEGELRPDGLGACVLDLIMVWMMDGITPTHENKLLEFFPNSRSYSHQRAIVCTRHMAGVVINEAFQLRLYLKISTGVSEEDLQENIFKLSVQTIKGFRNFYFLDVLLKMLLEPNLPIASLLSFEDADILYTALYDAVILIKYSFYSGRWAQSNDGNSKKLALLWLLVVERAIHFSWDKNDRGRVNLYLGAFVESELMIELIKWGEIQAGIVDQNNKPDINIPDALIKWLFILEDQGVQVFDHSVSLLYATSLSKVETTGRKRKGSYSGPFESLAMRVRWMWGRPITNNETIDSIIISSSEDDMDDLSLEAEYPDEDRLLSTENVVLEESESDPLGSPVRRVTDNETMEVINITSSEDDMDS